MKEVMFEKVNKGSKTSHTKKHNSLIVHLGIVIVRIVFHKKVSHFQVFTKQNIKRVSLPINVFSEVRRHEHK